MGRGASLVFIVAPPRVGVLLQSVVLSGDEARETRGRRARALAADRRLCARYPRLATEGCRSTRIAHGFAARPAAHTKIVGSHGL
eukprot:1464111-Pleurochrysis_carterae.AAC.1